MTIQRARYAIHLATLLSLFLAGTTASAQTTTITLTTAQGDCIATTNDPQGVHLGSGTSNLVAAGVTLSGAACGGVPVTPAPTNLVVSAPPTAQTGTPFNVSWTVQGGTPTTCVGTATKDSVAYPSLQGWTTTQSISSPRSVTATVVGSYQLVLTCSNAGGTVSAAATTVVSTSQGTGDCPATILSNPSDPNSQSLSRLMSSNITYGIYLNPLRSNMDMTRWESIWGYASGTDAVTLWPGPLMSSAVIRQFGRNTYLAAKFHVPSGFSTSRFGNYAHAINPAGPNVTASYSTRCGDFTPQPGTGCVITNWPDDLSQGLFWKSQSLNHSFCPLQANTDYYLNLKLTDPAAVDAACGAGDTTCVVYLQHTHN